MERLVAVRFRIVYIVGDAAWFLLKLIRQDGVEVEAGVLFRALQSFREDDFHVVVIVYVLEVLVLFLHFAPDAIRHAILHLDLGQHLVVC